MDWDKGSEPDLEGAVSIPLRPGHTERSTTRHTGFAGAGAAAEEEGVEAVVDPVDPNEEATHDEDDTHPVHQEGWGGL